VDMVMGGLMEVVKGETVMTWVGILRWTIIEREMVDRTEESEEVVCPINVCERNSNIKLVLG
jgi:hypothetical protein